MFNLRYAAPKILATYVLLLALQAAPALAANTTLTPEASGQYKLDKSHASITFTINHLGFSHYTGRFNDLDATLNFDAAKPENSKLEVTIIPNSIDTHNAKLEEELRGDKFFDVIKFRQISFVAKEIKQTSPTAGTVAGDFTMMGVTHTVTLDVTLNGAGTHPFTKANVLGFSATGSLKRSLFGMQNLIPMVGDDVDFLIEAEFDKVQ